jgi:opacity protein-like surface antigen
MKKLIGISSIATLGLGLSGLAIAADLPEPLDDPVIDSQFSIYLGAFAGAAFTDALACELEDPFCGFPSDGTNAVLGVLGGVNADFGNYLVGLEGDFGTYLDGDLSFTADFESGLSKIKWNGHLRGLVGTKFNGFELYVAGGLAVAEARLNEVDQSDSDVVYGWSAGIGIQGMVADNIYARLEYLHDDYSGGNFIPGERYSADWTDNIVRGALIFQLGGK